MAISQVTFFGDPWYVAYIFKISFKISTKGKVLQQVLYYYLW